MIAPYKRPDQPLVQPVATLQNNALAERQPLEARLKRYLETGKDYQPKDRYLTLNEATEEEKHVFSGLEQKITDKPPEEAAKPLDYTAQSIAGHHTAIYQSYLQPVVDYLVKFIEGKNDFSMDSQVAKFVVRLPKSVMGEGLLGFTYLGENKVYIRDDLTGDMYTMVFTHEANHTPDEQETRYLDKAKAQTQPNTYQKAQIQQAIQKEQKQHVAEIKVQRQKPVKAVPVPTEETVTFDESVVEELIMQFAMAIKIQDTKRITSLKLELSWILRTISESSRGELQSLIQSLFQRLL